MAKPTVVVTKLSGSGDFLARIKTVGKLQTLVGIPAGSADSRKAIAAKRAIKMTSPRKSRQKFKKEMDIVAQFASASNAQLLFWFSAGSPLRNQPARPVIEAAIHAPGNKEDISSLISLSIQAELAGKNHESREFLKRAGARAAKASRDWFEDSRNNWAPNAYSTSRKKQSDITGVATGIMRAAITHVEKEIE